MLWSALESLIRLTARDDHEVQTPFHATVAQDCGALGQTLFMPQSPHAGLGPGTCALDEQAVKHVLGWDDMTEALVLLMPAGA